MITQISYNVLIERFRAFATGHYLIEAFTHGELAQTDLEKDQRFPWMHVFPVEVEPRQGSRLYTFVVTFADLPRDKETDAEYQRESLSDCIRLAEDLLAEIQNGLILFGPTVELEGSATIEPFIKEFTHTLTGVNLTLTISVPWDWSACDIPADFSVGGSGSGGSGSGGAGLILETNGVLNGEQGLLNLQQGENVTIQDNGFGTITISAVGGGGEGTVTSVALTAPPAFSVSGSPITGAGTLALGAAGDSTEYIDGSGNLQTFPTIPDAQLPSDWNATTGVTRILNKPTIPAAQVPSDWAATTGVTRILNKPTIPAAQVNSDWAASSGLAEILNKPTIPAAQIQSDWAQTNTAALDYIKNKPSIGTGSVTSVALTMPAAFSVSGSPVTTAGTLAVTGAGTTAQYVRGDGSLATFPTLPPTVGDMLKSVYDLQDIGVVESAHKELVAVINKTGASVPAGSIVYLKTSSASGTFPEIVLATATTESGSSKTMGAVWQTIANDATGYVVTSGEVSNLNTSAYSIGDRLWLGTTAGSVTTTPPAEPNHTVFIGTVTRAQNTNGRILYAIQNGYELNELHGVQISTEANRQVLIYDSTSGLWINRLLVAADMPTGIDAANIGAGTVSNTEFGYLDGVSSAIQTQLNGKQSTIGLTTVGTNLATLANPNAIAFLRVNADNTVTARTPAQVLTDFGVSANIILNRNYADTSLGGTTTNTLIYSVLIPANTLQANDWINLKTFVRTNTAGTNVAVYLNTAPAIPTSAIITIATLTLTLNSGGLFERNFMIPSVGASGSVKYFQGSALSAFTPANNAASSATINTTVDLYLVFAAAPSAGATFITNGNIITLTR